ncbi:MAG TPA: endonuclease/exonuclease/phosphatase family protein [Acidimicrobiales bacterium]|nr:endonuclease/exonuclease/phosphatase family protein [Acidimicrobiales bacterium]
MRKPIGVALAALAVIAGLLPLAPANAVVTFSVGTPITDGVPLCGTSNGRSAGDDGAFTVADYNVLHSDTDEGDKSLGERMPLLADALADTSADVIGLEEVAMNLVYDPKNEYPQKHGLVVARLAALLTQRTGETWSWCFSRSNPHVPLTPDVQEGGGNPLDDQAAAKGNFPEQSDFSEGLAIVSRYPITRARFRRDLPRSYEAVACPNLDPFCRLDATFDARQVLYARVRTPQGALDMFVTHLAHGITPLSTTTKQLQARQTMALVHKWSNPNDALPDVLVGDFNSKPSSAALRTTAAGGLVDTYAVSGAPECQAAGGPGCSGNPYTGEETYTKTPTRHMSTRIDFILARPPQGCALRVPMSRMIGDRPIKRVDGRYVWPSDHNGFVSQIACAR